MCKRGLRERVVSILRHLRAGVKRRGPSHYTDFLVSVRTLVAACGADVERAWRRSRLGTIAVATLWAAAATFSLAVGLEIMFQVRSAYLQSHDPRRYTQLANAYEPFMTESLHPHYLFFFPRGASARDRMGNAVCSIDAQGFRQPGLASAGGRKLAFLMGGSVAFGLFASSNDTTITSYLNRLQDEYFFVNAGVPGFNSTQELVRLTLEIADYRPALIIAFDGWNDLTLAREPRWVERQIPAGTPEGFPALEEMVSAAQSPWRQLIPDSLFPELSLRLDTDRDDDVPDPPVPASRLANAAERYALNQQRMADVSRSVGAQFISVFQPLAALHRHVNGRFAGPDEVAETFHRLALANRSSGYQSYDMGRVFDAYFPAVPAGDDGIRDDTVFIDAGHLYDPGNEVVARHLLQLIRDQAPATALRRGWPPPS